MLTIITVLVILWLLGVVFSFGPLVHLLLVVILVVIVFKLIRGRQL